MSCALRGSSEGHMTTPRHRNSVRGLERRGKAEAELGKRGKAEENVGDGRECLNRAGKAWESLGPSADHDLKWVCT